MKVRFNEDNKKFITILLIVVACGIGLFFFLYRFKEIRELADQCLGMLTPFVLGFAFAFLLNKPMMLFQEKIFDRLPISNTLKRSFAAVLAIIFGILVVVLVMAMLLPQLVDSMISLVHSFPTYWDSFQKTIFDLLESQGMKSEEVMQYLTDAGIIDKATGLVTNVLPRVISYTYQFGATLFDIGVAIICAMYMLVDKERLMNYARKINYAILPFEAAKYVHRMTVKSAEIFNGFIVGKAIDSLIIGIICYIGSLIFQFPYAILLSVFVGITNMIPVFGPFIGAIPGIFILLIINPMEALIFAIFIFALQQFDGNILGPLILGDKLGLPSVGILFSVCIGAGLFGIVGMFIGVPCFAVIYNIVKEFVNERLKKKKIDTEHMVYLNSEE